MTEQTEIKIFSVRFPKNLWNFLRKNSVDLELSMNQLIIRCMESYKIKIEKNINRESKNNLTTEGNIT